MSSTIDFNKLQSLMDSNSENLNSEINEYKTTVENLIYMNKNSDIIDYSLSMLTKYE